jgi:hypothetical protein
MGDEPRGIDHPVERWTFATASARTSAGSFFNQDIGKLAYQSDDGTLWRLTATTPLWAPIGIDLRKQAFRDLGSAIQAFPLMGGIEAITTSQALTNAAVQFNPIYIPTPSIITGVKFYQSVQGVYTADVSNVVGLYTISAGTLTRVAISTDNGNLWKTAANTWGSQAFNAIYSANAGLHYVAFLYHNSAQTTAPTIGGVASILNGGVMTVDFANSSRFYGVLTSQTTLPTSQAMSGLLNENNLRWVALY